MARPLREQFAIASFLFLVPVGGVMALTWTTAYESQIGQLHEETNAFAKIVASYITLTHPPDDAAMQPFLGTLPLPDGGYVLVVDAQNHRVGGKNYGPEGVHYPQYTTAEPATVPDRLWTVSVGIPNTVAQHRTGETSRNAIMISVVATSILLAVQFVFLRRLLPALKSLERSTERVGAGDLSVPFAEHMPTRELEHLRDAFHDMVDKLRLARESIAHQVEEERHMRHELESLQQQVIRQERLAAIGVLVSGIAHELNNPLQAISGFSELLQKDPQIGAQARADLDLIHQESARAGAIIRNLSRFGRQQESTPVPVALSEVLTSVIELRQRRLGDQNIRLERHEQATKPAHAVFTELQQVALNFVINAEQSLRGCPTGNRRIILRTMDDIDGVRLEVEDTGPGVTSDNEAKLFQPFFTTKPVGEGTGLGLSVSYGIIRSLGGTIGYQRGQLGGALFFFIVPASGDSAA